MLVNSAQYRPHNPKQWPVTLAHSQNGPSTHSGLHTAPRAIERAWAANNTLKTFRKEKLSALLDHLSLLKHRGKNNNNETSCCASFKKVHFFNTLWDGDIADSFQIFTILPIAISQSLNRYMPGASR
jgi:hypothetical protein